DRGSCCRRSLFVEHLTAGRQGITKREIVTNLSATLRRVALGDDRRSHAVSPTIRTSRTSRGGRRSSYRKPIIAHAIRGPALPERSVRSSSGSAWMTRAVPLG